MVPASGCSSPTIIFSRVVLPTPFGPMTPTMPFGGRLKLSPSISIRSPNPLVSRSAFAADRNARLQWWYQHSKYQPSDNGRYPIVRVWEKNW